MDKISAIKWFTKIYDNPKLKCDFISLNKNNTHWLVKAKFPSKSYAVYFIVSSGYISTAYESKNFALKQHNLDDNNYLIRKDMYNE